MTHDDLIIRQATLQDAQAMIDAMKVEHLQNFTYFEQPPTLERQIRYIRKMLDSPHDLLFVIVYQGKIVGTCGLHEIDRASNNARLGVMIFSPEFRGKRIGSGAIRLLIDYGFKQLGLYKIYLKVLADNSVGCAKYSHMKLEFETRLRKHYYLRGEYKDMVMLSVFADEWVG